MSDSLSTIVDAARKLFARNGVTKTRMEDVAEAAGMTRQNLYRYVANRDRLVELAVLARCREFGAELSILAQDEGATDVRRLVIDLMVHGIHLGRADPEFVALSEAAPRGAFSILSASGQSPMHAIVGDTFGPVLRRADAAGILRTDVSEAEIVEWLQVIYLALTPRVDLRRPVERRLVEKFVLPALFI
jgi:AcrR family transcriptional regulator